MQNPNSRGTIKRGGWTWALAALACVWAWAWPLAGTRGEARADGEEVEDWAGEAEGEKSEAPRDSSRVLTFESAWATPFWEQRAWIMEMSFGGGEVGGQLERVLEDGGFALGMSLGWRWGLVSLEAPLAVQVIQTPVLSDVSLISWGARVRAYLPLWDGSVRLIGGVGFYKTWAHTCDPSTGEDSQCERSSGDDTAFAAYEGRAWETTLGVAVPILSIWDQCNHPDHSEHGEARGGLELLLSLEHRRMWFDLENEPFDRTMRGTVDAVLLSFTMEMMFID